MTSSLRLFMSVQDLKPLRDEGMSYVIGHGCLEGSFGVGGGHEHLRFFYCERSH